MVRTYQPKKRQRSKEHGYRQRAQGSGSSPRQRPRSADSLMPRLTA